MSDEARLMAWVEMERVEDGRRHGFKIDEKAEPDELLDFLRRAVDKLEKRIADDGGWR